jgi:hypothetical protein
VHPAGRRRAADPGDGVRRHPQAAGGPKQGGFPSLQLFTAVCPAAASGRAEGLITPRLDTASTQSLLNLLAETIPDDTHVALFWVNAGFHTAKALVVPSKITLLPLPRVDPDGVYVPLPECGSQIMGCV